MSIGPSMPLRLEKPERKLVLQIMDAQNLITEERSLDSFL